MRKKIKIMKAHEEEQYFCDLCGKQFSRGYCGNTMHVCKVCGKDICRDCAVIDDYFAWADDNAVVCKYCAEIVEPFKTKLDKEDEIYEIKKDKIWDELKSAAEKNFKKHQKEIKK